MATFPELIATTEVFFARHWTLPEVQPCWCSEMWTRVGSVPSHDKQGCYALVKDGVITYIGSAVGSGSSKHPNFGLSYRITSYLQKARNPIADKVDFHFKDGLDYDGLYTIGFPKEFAYLALALEQYLISQLAPKNNKRGIS